MPARPRAARPAMYNTPQIRNGGFGALQVEAITNRPLSIARRHLAASQLRMRDIEPDQLSSSEWVRFLVMEEFERDRWMTQFVRRRRNSDESSGSSSSGRSDNGAELDRETAHQKEEEAREEEADARRAAAAIENTPRPAPFSATPAVSAWARQFDQDQDSVGESMVASFDARRPRHTRRGVMEDLDGPPAYDSVVRASDPPPAYEPRSDDEEEGGAVSPRYERLAFQMP